MMSPVFSFVPARYPLRTRLPPEYGECMHTPSAIRIHDLHPASLRLQTVPHPRTLRLIRKKSLGG